MIANKHIGKISAMIMAAAVFLCLLAMRCPDRINRLLNGSGVSSGSAEAAAMDGTGLSEGGLDMEYASALFDTENVMELDIIMDGDDWNEMLQSAMSETYYQCDVIVNGTAFYNVGIRPKGNTSLSSIAMDPDNNRYSFKLEFDRYVEGQTCYGLDKLVLNNNYADPTNCKEAVIYDMYRYLGADASLYNYAKISVNGDYWGVYLALEAVEDSFLLRNYGMEKGCLYKPEFDSGEVAGDAQPQENPQQRGFGRNSGGSDLNYADDETDTYFAIWQGEVGKTSKEDHRRVVTALKNISEGTDLETYLDVDNVLRYMAVHSFAVNEDSLSGSMAHNYYLYESGGRLNILPWDYNLSFGGMSRGNSGNAVEMINDPIDTPFSGTQFFDALLKEEEYLERYHDYYRQLVEEYVFGGRFEEAFRRIRRQIDDLVREDPNAMYSYEEYTNAVSMLYDTVMLRGGSVCGQLEGTIPSTREGQMADEDALLDASSVDVSVMGSFSGGGGGRDGKRPERNMPGGEEAWPAAAMREPGGEERPDKMPQGVMPDAERMPERIMPEAEAGYTDFAVLLSGVILLAAILFAKYYSRRPYWRKGIFRYARFNCRR